MCVLVLWGQDKVLWDKAEKWLPHNGALCGADEWGGPCAAPDTHWGSFSTDQFIFWAKNDPTNLKSSQEKLFTTSQCLTPSP